MNTLIMFLALMQAPDARPVQGYAPPDEPNLLPLGSTRPESFLSQFALRLHMRPDVVCRLDLYETEYFRAYGLVGTMTYAVGAEWYLGHGLAANVEVGWSGNRFTAPLLLKWWPLEGLELSSGIDIFGGSVAGGLSLTP